MPARRAGVRFGCEACDARRPYSECAALTATGRIIRRVLGAIFNVLRMILGLILDIITLPFRALFALLGGAEFEFQRFSRPRR